MGQVETVRITMASGNSYSLPESDYPSGKLVYSAYTISAGGVETMTITDGFGGPSAAIVSIIATVTSVRDLAGDKPYPCRGDLTLNFSGTGAKDFVLYFTEEDL